MTLHMRTAAWRLTFFWCVEKRRPPPATDDCCSGFAAVGAPQESIHLNCPARVVGSPTYARVSGMAPSFKNSDHHDNIELATKWWDDYPVRKYTDFARAQDTYSSYISDVWQKPKRLMRSASYSSLTYVKEAQHELPIKRAPSVSSLAPSHALPYNFRVPERIVHTIPTYTPRSRDWYTKAYAPSRYTDTLASLRRPLTKIHPSFEYSSHVPYYTFQTKRIFFEQRYQPSYIAGSQRYLDKYVSARLKADDFAQRYVHTAYEAHRPSEYKINRNMLLGSQVCVPIASGNPRYYLDGQAVRRVHKLTNRFYHD
uniref:Uncharacterized protein n=1 Tax=Plectus sambesii TaxID=2011161 RepID=A0A914VCC4_9BILA